MDVVTGSVTVTGVTVVEMDCAVVEIALVVACAVIEISLMTCALLEIFVIACAVIEIFIPMNSVIFADIVTVVTGATIEIVFVVDVALLFGVAESVVVSDGVLVRA